MSEMKIIKVGERVLRRKNGQDIGAGTAFWRLEEENQDSLTKTEGTICSEITPPF